MKKYHVSDYWNKGIRGHWNYEFVDVVVNDDNLNFSGGREWQMQRKQDGTKQGI